MSKPENPSGAMLNVSGVSFTENEQFITVTVPIPHATAKNTDIFTSPLYVKIHSAPYLWHADLHDQIDDENSSATIGEGAVTLKLVKVR